MAILHGESGSTTKLVGSDAQLAPPGESKYSCNVAAAAAPGTSMSIFIMT